MFLFSYASVIFWISSSVLKRWLFNTLLSAAAMILRMKLGSVWRSTGGSMFKNTTKKIAASPKTLQRCSRRRHCGDQLTIDSVFDFHGTAPGRMWTGYQESSTISQAGVCFCVSWSFHGVKLVCILTTTKCFLLKELKGSFRARCPCQERVQRLGRLKQVSSSGTL